MSAAVMKNKSAVARVFTSSLSLNTVKTLLFWYVVWTSALKAQRHLRARGLRTSLQDVYLYISQYIRLTLRVPAARRKVDSQMKQAKLRMEDRLVPKGPNVVRHLSLPEEGKPLEWILAEMDKMDNENQNKASWRSGKSSGTVYHGGQDIEDIIVTAYRRYCVSNPLHPDIFPAVRKMEAEIVSICLHLYNNPTGAGVMTAGGTESIIMAIKTYRDWARDVKGITEPEMIIPASGDVAFDKGAAYLKIKTHLIPVDHLTRRVDLNHVKRAINSNTILLVGSCVNYPDGNQDDIVGLGKLAAKYNVGLHVDCCLGSFILPYLEKAGLAKGDENGRYKLEPFDFRVKGVTSISCDTHKYGFSPNGTSVIMYRDAQLRKYQYYVNPYWTGGVYASPSMSGSRPGALIAGAWAVMHYMGSSGYIKSCRSIVTSARKIASAIQEEIPELYVLGSPPSSVVAFASKHPKVKVFEVGDAMSKRGWRLTALPNPPAVHIACTRLTVSVVDLFVADLKDSVKEAKLAPSGQGAMMQRYGAKSSLTGPSMAGELATAFLDVLYKA